MIIFDNKIHKFSYGTGNLVEPAQKALLLKLYDYIYPFGLPAFPDEWSWEATNKRGTLIKRIRKWLHQHNLSLTDKQMSELGSYIGNNTDHPKDYTFRFTTDDWKSGEFGDEGSCYWTCRKYCRPWIRKMGGGAVQFFEKDKGYARAWLLPCENNWILFNGYGLDTLVIARIIATYKGIDYKHVNFYNLDSYDGDLYINGNGRGYVLGSTEESTIDMNLKISDFLQKCKKCSTWSENEYCEDCYNSMPRCHCGNLVTLHNLCSICSPIGFDFNDNIFIY